MQNAISTDQSVLVLVNAELNQGCRLKEIWQASETRAVQEGRIRSQAR